MAKTARKQRNALSTGAPAAPQLEQSTYEIIRHRLQTAGAELRRRTEQLNQARRQVFGTIPTTLLTTEQVSTNHHCIARDLVPVGDRFLFGFNVHLGLKTETGVDDVFAIYRFRDQSFHEEDLALLDDSRFHLEFKQLYKYYTATQFVKFHLAFPHLYMVFQVGKTPQDIKVFKWVLAGDRLQYVDNRSEHEVRSPPQHEFLWKRTHRDLHRHGRHPHISVENIIFVETIGGDLTIKIEDNTDDGQGIYREPVDDPDQTLDDADIFYALVGNLVLLKIRPFREQQFRYFIYNRKNHHILRQDSLEHSCLLLPEDHGIVFASGFYTQFGTYRTFDSSDEAFYFEKRIASANGEDYLFIFHQPASGDYLLVSYNVIEQRMDAPVRCQGYSLFENGHLLIFRAEESARRHHAIQIWQTPFTSQLSPSPRSDSLLFKIGNRDVVRAIAECHELLGLLEKDDTYSDLYLDLVRKSQQILDGYTWLREEAAFDLAAVIGQVKQAATAAVSEFDKVQSIRAATQKQFDTTARAAGDALAHAIRRRYQSIEEFVESLANLRHVRGQLISLRDLKYVDLAAVETLEQQIVAASESVAQQCVDFLAKPDALATYARSIADKRPAIERVESVVAGRELDADLAEIGGKLELLIDIVSNLQIDDATQRTAITDAISTIYATLNQTRAVLRTRLRELLSTEGAAEFAAQLKLLNQAVTSYLDVCDTPQRCDEYLTKMMVQVEEIEGRFAEFDEFVVQLAEKRDEIYSAFDTRKLQLVEGRNRRAMSLATAADRILGSIQTRVAALTSLDAINGYFAADVMVDKVRDIVRQLLELEDTVKVDELQSRLKTIREDAARQLRDRQELFVDGQNLIQLGQHRFTVNVQPLDLALVVQDDQLCFHITGTNFIEPVENAELVALRNYWDQSLVSENRDVYRAEYLAYLMFVAVRRGEVPSPHDHRCNLTLSEVAHAACDDLTALVQKYMAPRYAEGYIKGVHDHDAARILKGLAELDQQLGWMRFDPSCRALANLTWQWLASDHERAARRRLLETRINNRRHVQALIDRRLQQSTLITAIQEQIEAMRSSCAIAIGSSQSAAEFLYLQLFREERPAGQNAARLAQRFRELLAQRNDDSLVPGMLKSLPFEQQVHDIFDWLSGLNEDQSLGLSDDEMWEAVSLVLEQSEPARKSIAVPTTREIEGLLGDHPHLQSRPYVLDYHQFVERLERFSRESVPGFERFQECKSQLLAERRAALRLHEFKPHVLTSFVRNRLIDEVYLPLIGNNLAKQLGAAGENKRTDRMGLLLIISPPGYGKTTLMEYIANRLGLTFVKINGPALGHHVTSLDPEAAPHASAREEVHRLNLALEMGDNVMIYVDDIQHTHPEFLQKFISLCDATRRIEGVYRGHPKTYDLRGRKVCVVMAGNPYTESGESFKIPDMLANRADTYNLGDVIGGHQALFELSYIENAVTSSPVLSRLPAHGWEDVYTVLTLAQGGPAQEVTLRGNYSLDEIHEFVAVMRRLIHIRDLVLRVNRQYIDSAAQADAFRTEPRFQLQGSYRDMNKLAERVVGLMNDDEIETLLMSHYENQAQTLTTGAEANLLKFRELTGTLRGPHLERWNHIKQTFQRNLVLGEINRDDPTGQIIAQLALFAEGLTSIQRAVERGARLLTEPPDRASEPMQQLMLAQISQSVSELAKLNETVAAFKTIAEVQARRPAADGEVAEPPRQPIQIINRIPRAFLEVIRHQFEVLERWIEPLQKLAEIWPAANELTRSAKITRATYKQIVDQLSKRIADE